jgi:hypothetical protein
MGPGMFQLNTQPDQLSMLLQAIQGQKVKMGPQTMLGLLNPALNPTPGINLLGGR